MQWYAASADWFPEVGPKICVVKTHIDIMTFPGTLSPSATDSITTFTTTLQALSKKHNFLIFEDRKFADIGNTVKHQYSGGVYRIASWAHITNAHSVPGPSIIAGLKEVASGISEERGLLLLAEMSSSENLAGGEYGEKTLAMARANKDFVMGFIAMGAVEGEGEDWLVMTPGVHLARGGDGLGQQYKTPDLVVGGKRSDVFIVGRGIISNPDPLAEAERYRKAGWEAYEKRVNKA